MDTYRYHGHSMSDSGSTYGTCDEISNERQERDPIERVKKLLLAHDIASEKELKGQNLFDDLAEDILGGSRLGNKFCDSSKSQVLRSSSIDKERANDVAEYQSCVTC
ncbi:pyruvate dehydrogenase E1 component subunit alpha, mitochondrial-like [Arachis ipaensis]|uniref:pyruvate dehydrogenase E1 component subunit alpha, mitochondrial-like n=1 Tax=Arachis ipaensis TaxID=130454 RepID=UPI000A2B9165|nr:pyruvate dehydrogenase E1 component subunit alpha, mitochondrial-like [Arachis ipaensis]XP_020971476.1 pyruvate dehydrogenase E1 component subunit alpha, mitochondrial-like [Arachis ipaensis]